MSQEEIYRTSAAFYDAQYQGDLTDYQLYRRLAAETNDPILEIAVGTGRLAVPLAEEGHEVVGLDLSQEMLNIAEGKRNRINSWRKDEGKPPLKLTLLREDMCRFELERKFDLIYLPFNSFMLASTLREQEAVLNCVRRHLTPEGRFVLSLFNPSLRSLIERGGILDFQKSFVNPDSGNRVDLMTAVWRDLANQVMTVQFIFDEQLPDGTLKRARENLRMRYLFRYEAQLMLEKNGLELVDFYGDNDGSPFTAASPMMIFITKPA